MSEQPITYGFSLGDVVIPFLAILFQALPFLLVGALLSALLEKLLPAGFFPRILQRVGPLRYPLSALGGLAFPVCECAALPIARMLHRQGVPLPCCIIFLLASPVVNPLTLISTWAAFQNQDPLLTAALRSFCGVLLALVAGGMAALHKPQNILKPQLYQHHLTTHPPEPIATWSATLRRAISEFLDMVPYLIMGAALAAILTSGINRALLLTLGDSTVASVLVMMTASFALSLCASSDAFIIAPLIGIPWIAKMAFLILGPLIDLKLIVLYSSFFKKSFLLKITLLLIGGTALLCLFIQLARFPS